MVCEECVYKLDLLFEFREKSVKTETYLENVLKTIEQQLPLIPPPPAVEVSDLYNMISDYFLACQKGQALILPSIL